MSIVEYAKAHPGRQELREGLLGAVLYVDGKNTHEAVRERGANLRAWRDVNLPGAPVHHRVSV